MLQHGLQEFNNAPVWIPRRDILRPKQQHVEEQYSDVLRFSAIAMSAPQNEMHPPRDSGNYAGEGGI